MQLKRCLTTVRPKSIHSPLKLHYSLRSISLRRRLKTWNKSMVLQIAENWVTVTSWITEAFLLNNEREEHPAPEGIRAGKRLQEKTPRGMNNFMSESLTSIISLTEACLMAITCTIGIIIESGISQFYFNIYCDNTPEFGLSKKYVLTHMLPHFKV